MNSDVGAKGSTSYALAMFNTDTSDWQNLTG